MIKVFNQLNGRFGNSIFRYMACILFCILYEGELTYDINETTRIVTDDIFEKWMLRILEDGIIEDINGDFMTKSTSSMVYNTVQKSSDIKIQDNACKLALSNDFKPNIISIYNKHNADIYKDVIFDKKAIDDTKIKTSLSKPKGYLFSGYFQFEKIYNMFRDKIIEWIRTHPDDYLISDNLFKCKSYDLINPSININPPCDIVVHIRLKDFLSVGWVIHPLSLQNILDTIKSDKYCFIMETPVLEIEKRYLQYFKKRYNIILQSGLIMEDFYCIRNAKQVICSLSTLSWMASFFSETLETVYMPDTILKDVKYKFNRPIKNTIYYESKLCNLNELEDFFNHTKTIGMKSIIKNINNYDTYIQQNENDRRLPKEIPIFGKVNRKNTMKMNF